MNKQYKQLLSNTGIFAAAKMAAKMVVFFLLPVYTNILTTAEYGTTELVLTYANFLVPVLSLSIQESVFRFGLDEDSDKKAIISDAAMLTAVMCVITCCVFPLLSKWLDIKGYENLFMILMVTMMFRQIFNLFLKACGKNLFFAIDTVIYSASLAIFNIIFLVVIGMRVNGYILALILANITSIAFCVITGRAYSFLSINSLNLDLLKKMLVYSIPLILNQVSWWIANSSDRLILSKLDSMGSVGIYSAAAKIPAIVSNFISVFIQAWVISAVTQYKSKDGKKFFEEVFQIFHFGLIMVITGILIFNKLITRIMLGPDFQSAYFYAPTLLLSSLYLGYAYFWGVLYTAEKKNIPAMISTLITALSNIVLDILLIPKFGIHGACIATCVTHLFLAIYRAIDTKKILTFDIRIKRTILSNIILIFSAVLMTLNFHGEVVMLIGAMIQIALYQPIWNSVLKKLLRRTQSK